MGKKRIIAKTKEELLKEGEEREQLFKKGSTVEVSRQVKEGRIYIASSFNNTTLTLTDARGNVLYWTSAGKVGFKGTRKGTPFAASKATEPLLEALRKIGIEKVFVFVKGIGSGRGSVLRSLGGSGINIVSIEDITPIPHNGCRPKKQRRV